MHNEQENNLTELRSKINQYYTIEELRTLCFDLEIDFDQIAGENKQAKVRELILYCNRHNRSDALIHLLKTQRSHVQWPEAIHLEIKQPIDGFNSGFFRENQVKSRERKNQLLLLEKVNSFWIEGVLEQSLHNQVLIELGKETDNTAVEYPWDLIVERPETTNELVPPGTKIIDIFEDMGKSLLILGEPGSGKTITLLELAREAIIKARTDATKPIPVVFNLSSWADKRENVEDWLVAELNSKYQIPKRIARPWVENDSLLLLLDGLDEVEFRYRAACVDAINDFRSKFGLTAVTICSRIEDYQALGKKLDLQGAIRLQPLGEQQIHHYFEAAGSQLASVKKALETDSVLQELTESPLTLSIMSLAYRNISLAELQKDELNTVDKRRNHLFDTYIDRMIARRKGHNEFSPEKLKGKLTWLASRLVQHKQSVFMLEEMQPSWLNSQGEQIIYALLTRLVIGFLIGLVLLLIAIPPDSWWLLRHFEDPEQRPLIIFSVFLTWFCIVLVLGITVSIRFVRQRSSGTPGDKESLLTLTSRLIFIYLISIIIFFFVFRFSWPIPNAQNRGILLYAVFFCILPTVLTGLRGRWQSLFSDIRIVDNFSWSWRRFSNFFIPIGLLVTFIVFVSTNLNYSPGIRVFDVENENFLAAFDASHFLDYEDYLFVYGNSNQTMWIWNLNDQSTFTISGVNNIELRTDEDIPLLIAYNEDNSQVWKIANDLEFSVSVPGRYVAYSSSTSLMVTVDGGLDKLWLVTDVVTPLGNIQNEWWNSAFFIVVDDSDSSKLISRFNGQETTISNEISGKIIRLTSDGNFVLTENEAGKTQLWQNEDGVLLGEVRNYSQDAYELTFVNENGEMDTIIDPYSITRGVAGGAHLVVERDEGAAELWRNEDMEFLGELLSRYYSPYLFVIYQNHLRVFEQSNGQEIEPSAILYEPNESNIRFIVDGVYVLTVDAFGHVQLWQSNNGALVGDVINNWQSQENVLAINDGDRIYLMDRHNGKEIMFSNLLDGRIVDVISDGSYAVIQDEVGKFQLWNVADREMTGDILNDWMQESFLIVENAESDTVLIDQFTGQEILLPNIDEENIVGGVSDWLLVITQNDQGRARLWRSSDGLLVGDVVNTIYASGQNALLVNREGNSILIDKFTGEETHVSNKIEGSLVGGVSDWLYVITRNDFETIQLWRTTNGVLLGNIINDWQFDRYLIVATEEGNSLLVDKISQRVKTLADNIKGEIVSGLGEGDYLVTRGEAFNEQLWRSSEGILLGDIINNWRQEQYLIIKDENSHTLLIDAYRGGEVVLAKENIEGTITSWIPLESYLVTENDHGKTQLWNKINGNFVGDILNAWFAWSFGDYLIVLNELGHVNLISPLGSQTIVLPEVIEGTVLGTAANGMYIVTTSESGKYLLWRISDGILMGTILNDFDWRFERFLIVQDEEERYLLIDNASGENIFMDNITGRIEEVTSNGLYVVTQNEGSNYQLWRISDGILMGTILNDYDWRYSTPFLIVKNANGDSFLIPNFNDRESIPIDDIEGRIVSVSGDWLYIVTEDDKGLNQLWSSTDGTHIGQILNEWENENFYVVMREDEGFFIYPRFYSDENSSQETFLENEVWENEHLLVTYRLDSSAMLRRKEHNEVLGTILHPWWNTSSLIVEDNQGDWILVDKSGVIEHEFSSDTMNQILHTHIIKPQLNNFSSLNNVQALGAERKYFAFEFSNHQSDYRYLSLLPLLMGLVLGFVAGLQSSIRESKTRPNQGTFLSLRNSLVTGIFVATTVGIILGGASTLLGYAAFAISSEYSITLSSITIVRLSLGIGLLVTLWLGLIDISQHIILRIILIVKNRIFLRYVRFLDIATEKILLRKVGGGYIFVHRLLMEHFALLEKRQLPP